MPFCFPVCRGPGHRQPGDAFRAGIQEDARSLAQRGSGSHDVVDQKNAFSCRCCTAGIHALYIVKPFPHAPGIRLPPVVLCLVQKPLTGQVHLPRDFLRQEPGLVISPLMQSSPAERHPAYPVILPALFAQARCHQFGIDSVIRRSAAEFVSLERPPHRPCIIQRREAKCKIGNIPPCGIRAGTRNRLLAGRAQHSAVLGQFLAEGTFGRIEQVQKLICQRAQHPAHPPQASSSRIRSAL